MGYFYTALFRSRGAPCSAAEALREARLQLRDYRDTSGHQPFAHPAHWGSFVLLGDPG
jgi:CHAT domain-containing protein